MNPGLAAVTFRGELLAEWAKCDDCPFEVRSGDGLALELAEDHAEQLPTHQVRAARTIGVTYNRKDAS
jgi:hypothetical protein